MDSSSLESRNILGARVHCATYQSALEEVKRMALAGRPAAVSACNTHIVALARSSPDFGRVMAQFDLVLPDGYPLIWELNLQGAGLEDRVYGPYFMRYVLSNTPAPYRHFFFGGSENCLKRLTAAAQALQPDIVVAGTLSPPYRAWTEEEEAGFAKTIAESRADFIWVALGGERQERWIIKNRHRYQSGVFFAVGDAFELLAGSRPFAPAWMQRMSLTWLYRLCQEPGRLWPRYVKFNSLFLYYRLRDAIWGTPEPPRADSSSIPRRRIAFLGSRGVPARYSGFEVVVEELGSRLADLGHEVTVYNRYPRFATGQPIYKGMRIRTLPTIPTKNLDTIFHTTLSALDALLRNYEIIYLCGVGNSILAWLLRRAGLKVVINVDGADFRRAKWGGFGRYWLRRSEKWATRLGDRIIADNREIVARYQREYRVTPDYISYGCLIRTNPLRKGELERWGLKPNSYILHVSRLTPENEADLLLRAFRQYRGSLPLVICGSHNYEHAYYRKLRDLADDRVIFTGPRYGEHYVELSQHARFFVMPAAIEATRLVLLDQMGMGKAILFKESAATREVVADTGEAFSASNPEEALAAKMEMLSQDPARCKELGELALQRAEAVFSWDAVVRQYEALFVELDQVASKR